MARLERPRDRLELQVELDRLARHDGLAAAFVSRCARFIMPRTTSEEAPSGNTSVILAET